MTALPRSTVLQSRREPDHDPLEDTLDEEAQVQDFWSGFVLPQPHRIAVAEDDDDMRRLIVRKLERDGYVVDELADGDALMDYLHSVMDPRSAAEAPDVLVTDVRMPGRSGVDVLDFLHAVSWPVPVVVMTAFGDRATQARALELGALRVLNKPFALAELELTIFAALVDSDGGGDVGGE